MQRDGTLFDEISGAPASTEFAISRFLVPALTGFSGWAMFVDCDVLARADLARVMEYADPKFAVVCVQQRHDAEDGDGKMDGQLQTAYPRKNWSSVMLFNCSHPQNQSLSPAYVEAAPGRDLHGFAWLDDAAIGELPIYWNSIPGVTTPFPDNPAIVHYSLGMPILPGYEDAPFADEWFAAAGATPPAQRAAAGGVLPSDRIAVEPEAPEAFVPLADGRNIPVTTTAPGIGDVKAVRMETQRVAVLPNGVRIPVAAEDADDAQF